MSAETALRAGGFFRFAGKHVHLEAVARTKTRDSSVRTSWVVGPRDRGTTYRVLRGLVRRDVAADGVIAREPIADPVAALCHGAEARADPGLVDVLVFFDEVCHVGELKWENGKSYKRA